MLLRRELGKVAIFSDAAVMARESGVEVVVDALSDDGASRRLAEAAIEAGVHIITSNARILACGGGSLAAAAEEAGNNCWLCGGVASGFPAWTISTGGGSGYWLASSGGRDGETAVRYCAGLLDIQSNRILAEMGRSGRSYNEVRSEIDSVSDDDGADGDKEHRSADSEARKWARSAGRSRESLGDAEAAEVTAGSYGVLRARFERRTVAQDMGMLCHTHTHTHTHAHTERVCV